jgi:hypothetical protein
MDPLTLRSLGWAMGLLLLIAIALVAVVLVRRRTVAPDEPGSVPPRGAQADWVGLLTALRLDRMPAKSWMVLGPQLAVQAASCPAALRQPLIVALDAAIARSSDPFATAAMTQVRSALAALPAA